MTPLLANTELFYIVHTVYRNLPSHLVQHEGDSVAMETRRMGERLLRISPVITVPLIKSPYNQTIKHALL